MIPTAGPFATGSVIAREHPARSGLERLSVGHSP